MEFKIQNDNYDRIKFNTWFAQPKYYFGQLLKVPKGKSGIVLGMSFIKIWQYIILDSKTNQISSWYREDELTALDEKYTSQLMTIKISNHHLETFNCSLRFTQPKYHFGQLLKFPDEEGLVGVVTEMHLGQGSYTFKYTSGLPKKLEEGWHYELIETSDFPPLMGTYTEKQLLVPQLLAQSS